MKKMFMSSVLPDAMVSPYDSLTLPAVAALRGNVSFRTINDYGAIIPIKYTVLK